MATDSKQRMLTTTASLLQRQGYHGTGLNQIIKESKAPKGSLYFHFPGGKQELATAALEQSGHQMRDALRAVIGNATSVGEAIRAVTTHLADRLDNSAFNDGCPMATVALEAAASSDALQEVCSQWYGNWEDLVAEHLQQLAGADETTARQLALLVLSAIEGALLLSRAHRDTRPLRAVGDQMAALAQLMGHGSTPPPVLD